MFGLFKKKNKIGESRDTAVFTTRNVMRENFPITRVYHGKDGSWQFFDNVSTNSIESLMIVEMGEVLKKIRRLIKS